MEKLRDPRVVEFEYWHEAVFGRNPVRAKIPFRVMRDYLDFQLEVARNEKGATPFMPNLSIREIKENGALVYKNAKAMEHVSAA